MPRLRRSRLDQPGIRRRRYGKGFRYFWQDGSRVDDEATLERIRGLVVPPAWRDVWICPWPNGHIQAIGVDAAGRRQYRYHDEWRRRRDAEKFDRMIEFAAALPSIRARVAEDLRRKGYPRERVLALAVRLLDVGLFRAGSEEYAEENDTDGLATLERDHVRFRGRRAVFDYTAKFGKERVQEIADPESVALLRKLARRQGGSDRLLAWRAGSGWTDLRSEDVNAYLKEIGGDTFTAKDFRTWGATVLCAVLLAGQPPARSATGHRRSVAAVLREVAEILGNTPAVCRKSYVDPRLVDRFASGETIAAALREGPLPPQLADPAALARLETAVAALLAGEEERPVRSA